MIRGLGIAALAGLVVFAGCGENGSGTGTTTAEMEQGDAAAETEAQDLRDETGASTRQDSSPRSSPPPPELAPVYSAKITRVDASSTDRERYDVEVVFTSAQGRSFTAIVTTEGGTLVLDEAIPDVPDAYYSHTFSFRYSGSVEDLNVQIIAPDEKTILDKWDL